MKINTKEKDRDFDTVKVFREIKKRISHNLLKMDVNQIKKYLASRSKGL